MNDKTVREAQILFQEFRLQDASGKRLDPQPAKRVRLLSQYADRLLQENEENHSSVTLNDTGTECTVHVWVTDPAFTTNPVGPFSFYRKYADRVVAVPGPDMTELQFIVKGLFE